ncbi:MAG: hypothetical protein R3D98_02770 [Candidatus Krumholzibacteriia bacterium]
MKTLLTLALVALMAGSAFAQLDNSMGMFFSDSDLTEANTNLDNGAAPFNAYIAVIQTTMFTIGAYEVGIEISNPAVFLLSVSGPNGWTNFGSNTNHLAGFQTPLPSSAGYAVMSTIQMLYTANDLVEVRMGPSSPSSVGGAGPALADGSNPDILYVCNYTSGPDMGGLVATLNGDGITFPGGVAAEAHSLSAVKALFN